MTREQSKITTKVKIRNAKSGKEITEAFMEHFRKFTPTPEEELRETVEYFGAPLLAERVVNLV